MINFGNIKSYPTFSSYQRLKTIKSKELTERKNLKKGTIKSYKDYLDKKNGFKCCNGIYEQCCYCLTGKNALNENCLDASSKYNCFPCPKWRNVLRVANNFVSIHVSNKGKYIIAAGGGGGGSIHISTNVGNTWTSVNTDAKTKSSDASGRTWIDIVGAPNQVGYVTDSSGEFWQIKGETLSGSHGSGNKIYNHVDDRVGFYLAANLAGDNIKFASTTKDGSNNTISMIAVDRYDRAWTNSQQDRSVQSKDVSFIGTKVATWVDISTDNSGFFVAAVDSSNNLFVSVNSNEDNPTFTPNATTPITAGNYISVDMSGDGKQIIIADNSNNKLWISRKHWYDNVNNFDTFSDISNNDESFLEDWEFVKSSDNGRCIVASATTGEIWLSGDYGNSWDNIKTFDAGAIKDISIAFDDENNQLHLVVAENKNLWNYIIDI